MVSSHMNNTYSNIKHDEKKGGKNYNKTKLKIARLHEKIKNTRKHYLNKITNKTVLEDVSFSNLSEFKPMENRRT